MFASSASLSATANGVSGPHFTVPPPENHQALKAAENPDSRDGATFGDTLDISEEAMAISNRLDQPSRGIRVGSESIWIDLGQIGAYLGVGLYGDMNSMLHGLSLLIELQQEDVQERIVAVLQENGIQLAEDQRLDLEVDEQGNITVRGIEHRDRQGNIRTDDVEDSKKVAAIEAVLAEDATLGKDLLRLRAKRAVKDAMLSRIIKNAKLPDDSKTSDLTAPLTGSDAAWGLTTLDVTTRRFLLEDYLAERNTGAALDELSIQEGHLRGGSERLEALVAAFPSLAREIADVITDDSDRTAEDSGEMPLAVFSLQNGTLVDQASVNQAAIEEKLFVLANREGLVQHPSADTFLDAVFKYNQSAIDVSAPLLNDFSMAINGAGKISISGNLASGEDLGGKARMIESWFTEGFVDVVQAVAADLLNLHAAEHGDVEDYRHAALFEVNAVTGFAADVRWLPGEFRRL